MSIRDTGSYIGFNRVTSTSQGSASGIWSLRAVERQMRATAWPQTFPFAPDDISGLQLWLDASAAETLFDATTGGSLVAADGTVKRWEDKSGNNRHATEATNGPQRKTAVQGGKDVLRFDGTNDKLSIASSTSTFDFLHNATGGIVFAVYKANAASGLAFVWCNNTNPSTGSAASQAGAYFRHDTSDAATPNRYVAISNTPDGFRMAKGSAQNTISSGQFLCVAVQHEMAQENDADRHEVWLNGSQITGTDSLGVNQSAELQTGNASNNFHVMSNVNGLDTAAGDLCELIVYSGVMSQQNRQSVENYLLGKWGIA